MWTLLAAVSLTIFGSCKTGSQANISNVTDTVLLYKKDTLLITSIVPAILHCHFSASALVQYNNQIKTLLILNNPTVETIPEGVFEVYVTNEWPSINELTPTQTGFVSVLDLYSLTAPSAGSSLEVDISEVAKQLFLQKESLPSAYISIRFGAIKLPDGSYSSKAGELRITGIQIVQVKN
jgi:hypothetical protein